MKIALDVLNLVCVCYLKARLDKKDDFEMELVSRLWY